MKSATRLAYLSWSLCAAVAFAAGCNDRLYQFNGTIAPTVDGGPADVTTVDRSPDRGSGGGGGAGGTGGVDAGGSGGTGGGAGGTGGGVVVCSDSSPERQTDIGNCGRCFNL